jgi:hypothetical protein
MAETGRAITRTGIIVVAGLLSAQILAVAAFCVKERSSPPPADDEPTPRPSPGTLWQENHFKPTLTPPTLKASAAAAWLGEPIIGVEVGGKHRAYRVGGFDDASGHLVNDLVGGVPVSVAHSNLDGTARVYTDPDGSTPLDAEVTGLLNRQMVIELDGVLYYHASGAPVEPDKHPRPIPYRVLDPVLTTWERWVRLHPESDLFVGDSRTFPQQVARLRGGINDPARKMQAQKFGGEELPRPPRPRSGP